jgi:hypothetical protein
MKFRIIKIDSLDLSGSPQARYKIQSRKLRFWTDHYMPVMYHTSNNITGYPYVIAFFNRETFTFNSLTGARELLDKLQHPVKFRYRGQLIERRVDRQLRDVWVNLSCGASPTFTYKIGYQFESTLEELKTKIDISLYRPVKTVVQ